MNDGTAVCQMFLDRVKGVLGATKCNVALHEPTFRGNEWKYVKDCLDSGWVSSVGKYVDQFEEDLAEYTGSRKVICTVNGTAALHICLKLAGVVDSDEVLVPALTFVATANAVTYCNAVPHFVDSEERTLGVDPMKIGDYLKDIAIVNTDGCINKYTNRRIKAVLPMHTFGHPVDLDPLVELSSRYRLELIEDAAESLGSFYKGRHTGTFGRMSALSFNGNKIVTTGGGGAILTQDDQLGRIAKHLTTTARTPHKWFFDHEVVGYNYRMPNINAALGCAQLETIATLLEKKRRLAMAYRDAFDGDQDFSFFVEPNFAVSNYWLNVVLLNPSNFGLRDQILECTNSNGVATRPAWTLMHRLPMFSDCPRMDLMVAESIEQRLINIPSSASLAG